MILFPTDFSVQSSKTFGFALAMAKKLNQQITLLHVYHIPVMNPATIELGTNLISDEMMQLTENTAEDRLKQFKEELKSTYSDSNEEFVRVLGMVRMGLVADEIVRSAEEIQADFIVLGIKHSSGLSRALFGSSVMQVIKRSKTGVITVPEKYKHADVHHIAYATDLTFSDNEIINRLLALAKNFSATVKCFHVHDSKLDTENLIIKEFIEQYKTEANAGLIYFQLIDNLNVVDGIDYFVKEHKIDLLCVMKQKHYWIDIFDKQITKHLVFHEDVPMLIYHE
ncbi:MAG: universal stress protein [Chitinophagales bacterium]